METDRKIDSVALAKQMSENTAAVAVALTVYPLMLKHFRDEIKSANPEAYYSLKSNLRNLVGQIEKALPDLKSILDQAEG